MLAEWRLPGVAIGLVVAGDVETIWAYGLADVDENVPITIDTRFNVGSVSKVVTATGAMVLVERGQLDLERPIVDYLAPWKIPSDGPPVEEITASRLLSHTAGFSLATASAQPSGSTLPPLKTRLADADVRLVHRAGERHYSAGGFGVLQLLIEHISSQEFEAFMTAAVFKPLGMNATSFRPESPHHTATPYLIGHYSGLP